VEKMRQFLLGAEERKGSMAKAADVMLILNEACSSGEYNFSFHDLSATKMACKCGKVCNLR